MALLNVGRATLYRASVSRQPLSIHVSNLRHFSLRQQFIVTRRERFRYRDYRPVCGVELARRTVALKCTGCATPCAVQDSIKPDGFFRGCHD